jgi:hypothetical protein
MSKLAQLKKSRGANLKKLQEKLEQANQGGAPRDERIWKPKFNQEKGKGTAIVRFLTPKDGDPFIELKSYSFNGPKGNFWGNALQTIGEKDPVQIAAINGFKKAKAEGDERLKTECKKFLPRSQFYANVLVIKDEENPENEGKVKIFQFGRQIYSFIEKAIEPEFDDVDPFDPFCYWGGADFKIRMVGREIPDSRTGKKVTVPNYEASSFDSPSELFDGDEDQIDEIFQQTFDLSEFVAPEKFKSFDEVADQFQKAMGKPYNWLSDEGVEEHVEQKLKEQEMEEEQAPNPMTEEYDEPEEKEQPQIDHSDEDEDPLAKFRRLAGK